MNLGLWCMICIPVMLGCMCLHIEIKGWGKKPWNIIPKCLSTWMVVCSGILGLWFSGNAQGMAKGWIIAALVLFFLADAFLEVHFFLGMAVFGIGHGVLIFWFLKNAVLDWKNLVLWILLCGIAILLFRKELQLGKNNPKLYAMTLYPGILMGMTSIAVMLPFQRGSEYLFVAAGAVLFSISDMMVGKSFFHKLSKPADYLALTLYYSGIFCFSLFLWM